jgi:hypothetical protein
VVSLERLCTPHERSTYSATNNLISHSSCSRAQHDVQTTSRCVDSCAQYPHCLLEGMRASTTVVAVPGGPQKNSNFITDVLQETTGTSMDVSPAKNHPGPPVSQASNTSKRSTPPGTWTLFFLLFFDTLLLQLPPGLLAPLLPAATYQTGNAMCDSPPLLKEIEFHLLEL